MLGQGEAVGAFELEGVALTWDDDIGAEGVGAVSIGACGGDDLTVDDEVDYDAFQGLFARVGDTVAVVVEPDVVADLKVEVAAFDIAKAARLTEKAFVGASLVQLVLVVTVGGPFGLVEADEAAASAPNGIEEGGDDSRGADAGHVQAARDRFGVVASECFIEVPLRPLGGVDAVFLDAASTGAVDGTVGADVQDVSAG